MSFTFFTVRQGSDAALARLQLELLPSALGTHFVEERRWKGPRTQHHEWEVWKITELLRRVWVNLEWRRLGSRLGKCDSNLAQKSSLSHPGQPHLKKKAWKLWENCRVQFSKYRDSQTFSWVKCKISCVHQPHVCQCWKVPHYLICPEGPDSWRVCKKSLQPDASGSQSCQNQREAGWSAPETVTVSIQEISVNLEWIFHLPLILTAVPGDTFSKFVHTLVHRY